jgi:hypothetical protein
VFCVSYVVLHTTNAGHWGLSGRGIPKPGYLPCDVRELYYTIVAVLTI